MQVGNGYDDDGSLAGGVFVQPNEYTVPTMNDSLCSSVGLSLSSKDGSTKLSFREYYETDERLRSGSFGTVYTCHPKGGEEKFAVKVIDRKRLKKKDDDNIFREVGIMKDLRGLPHVVRLLDFFIEPDCLYIVLVYAAGGDVFDRLSKRAKYTEKDARDLAKILLETMRDIHAIGIVHRDLKPENLLLRDGNDATSILVADFGFARHVGEKGCQTRCGTPAFVAPEILTGQPYFKSVDLWSSGCLLYMLLGGYPPFQAENHRALFRKIRAGDYIFHSKYFKNVSIPAKQLISNLLTVSAKKRWTAEEALGGEWFKKKASDLLEHDLSPSILELQKFNPTRKWRSAGKAIRWATTQTFWSSDKVSFNQQMKVWDQSLAMDESTETEQKTVSSEPPKTLLNRLPTLCFADVYELRTKLRSGSYATVWLGIHKATKEEYAIKVIQRKGLSPKDDEAVLNEVAIMQSLSDNKYVVHLMDFIEEDDFFYIVMEYVKGGDVFDRIVKMTHYTEKDARDLAETLLKAVASLHDAGVAHRDLKPQNLLLRSESNHAAIKLADFGFARRVHTPQSLTTRVGTPTYVAPEVLRNIPHDERVDNWSIGVIIFVLLVGYPPFMDDDQSKLFQMIRSGEWSFHKEDWKYISPEAKDLVSGLLVADPKDRWSISEALRSPWINKDPTRLSTVNLTESVRVLKAKKNRLRGFARTVMWSGKESKPIEIITQAHSTASYVLDKLKAPS